MNKHCVLKLFYVDNNPNLMNVDECLTGNSSILYVNDQSSLSNKKTKLYILIERFRKRFNSNAQICFRIRYRKGYDAYEIVA